MLTILKLWPLYSFKFSCHGLFKVKWLKNYKREIKNFLSCLKLIKLPLKWHTSFPRSTLKPEINTILIWKNWKKMPFSRIFLELKVITPSIFVQFCSKLATITLIHSGCWQIPKPRNFERTKVPYPKNHKNLKIVCRTFGGGIKMYFFGLEVYNFWRDGYLETAASLLERGCFFQKICFDFFLNRMLECQVIKLYVPKIA